MKKRVEFQENVDEIKLVGRSLGPFKEGEEVRVRPWEAEVLEERGLAVSVDDFSLVGVRKRLMRERDSSQLRDLPDHFYLTVSCEIDKLRRDGNDEKAEEMEELLDSFLSIRVQKLAKMAISSSKPRNIPPEEEFLMNRVSRALEIWRRRMDSLLGKKSTEEVGANEGEIRRSIRRVVGKPANI